jgi:hypothetical protein
MKTTPKPKIKRDRNGLIRCRVCGCTELDACDPPCAWVLNEEDLCTTCGDISVYLASWLESARRPNLAALLREAGIRPRKGRAIS